MYSSLIVIICLFPCYHVVKSADILLLSPVPSKSIGLWYNQISLLLAQHGHKVTILSTVSGVNHTNITHRTIKNAYSWLDSMEKFIEQNPDVLDQIIRPDSITQLISYYTDPTLFGCDTLLKSKESFDFMMEFKNKKFDLIISDLFCECFFGFVHYFDNPPLIVATTYYDFDVLALFGAYNNPSYVPSYLYWRWVDMNFMERVQNSMVSLLATILMNTVYYKRHHEIAKELFGNSLPPIEEIISNTGSIAMVGYHPVLHGAKPLPPTVVPIAGIQIDDPIKPLPNDIMAFLNRAKDGAILFSLGSNFKSVLMSPNKRNMMIDVFKQLPQKIIWKLEENITDLPPNIMIKSWIPQSSILGHPNVILFISHGGLNGILEAVYHGVPLLGLPLMFDQLNNLQRLEKMGAAQILEYAKLDRNYLYSMIKTMTSNDSMRDRMTELSSAFRDNPQTPRERFLYWVDFVLRRKHNCKYLKPESVNLHWYQRTLLDVVAFCIFILLIVLWLIKSFLKIMFSLCNTKVKND